MNIKLPLLTGALALSIAIVPAAMADDGSGQVGFSKTHPNTPRAEALADGLGMEVEDLLDELQSGKTLYDISLEQGVAEEDLDAYWKHYRPRKQSGIYLANQFGITVEELRAELATGKTVEELAVEYNADFDELMETGVNYWKVDVKIRFHHKIAMELGMTDAELKETLDSGVTLEELANENDLDLSEYKKFNHTKQERENFDKLAETIGTTSAELRDEVRPDRGAREYLRNNGYNIRQLKQDIRADREANQE